MTLKHELGVKSIYKGGGRNPSVFCLYLVVAAYCFKLWTKSPYLLTFVLFIYFILISLQVRSLQSLRSFQKLFMVHFGIDIEVERKNFSYFWTNLNQYGVTWWGVSQRWCAPVVIFFTFSIMVRLKMQGLLGLWALRDKNFF